ncbi:MAG: glycine--tRNA ligase [Planctomycetes bacterium]|nr:glycine--tRNA ligase [Planctomycetota bacterium]
MERIVALCRRRGFIFGSSEIYGGIGGFWDYGPLGTELKRNIKDVWWHDMVTNPPIGPDGKEVSMVGLDCAIIMNPKVWEASGHLKGFADPMRDCKECKLRFRDDWLGWFGLYEVAEIPAKASLDWISSRINEGEPSACFFAEIAAGTEHEEYTRAIKRALKGKKLKWSVVSGSQLGGSWFCTVDGKSFFVHILVKSSPQQRECCPNCGGELTDKRDFNLMFVSHTGAVKDESSKVYLRPETAQGIFVNYKNVMDSTRVKIPFGIAQIGKAFRNEINPRNYTFRSREFEQMEIEFFCPPKDSKMWYEFWRDLRLKWYESLGIKSENLRPREQGEDELAHYSDACTDVEYLFPFSDEPQELEGIAHRGDFDLKAHGVGSKNKENTFAVLDDDTKERYVPHVIEPSAGVDRFLLATLCEAYTVDESRPSPEFLKFHPRLAPIKAAVFPLVKKDGMPEVAEQIYRDIKPHYICQFDIKQSIGKRYARMDEAGTPYCFTVDGQTLEDGTVTVRDRDTGQQERIDKSKCLEYLREKLQL